MHYLLIPYLLLGSLFVLQFHARKDVSMRTGLVVTALVIAGMLCIAIIFRPVVGDSWRYNQYFQVVRTLPFPEIFSYRDPDPAYALLNWIVGQVSASPALLFAAVLALYVGVTVIALRRWFTAVELAVLSTCLVAFPFFITYAANGLRQGIGLAFLLAGYLGVRKGRRSAWLWILSAPLWHSAMLLGVGVFLVHQLMCRLVGKQTARWNIVFAVWGVSLILSLTGWNAVVGGLLPAMVTLGQSYDIYFMDPNEFGYQSGFRADFALFSLVPLMTGFVLRRRAFAFDYRTIAGWMLSLYVSLNIIYHLFSFAPFADRFAAFSWWLMPLVVFLQVRATQYKSLMSMFVTLVVLVNAAMLQLYTGKFLPAPEWWG
jgi:hypothetical protein